MPLYADHKDFRWTASTISAVKGDDPWVPIRRALAGGDAYNGAVSGNWGGGTLLTGLTEKKMEEIEATKLSKVSLLGR